MKGWQRLIVTSRWSNLPSEVFDWLSEPMKQVEELLRQAVQSPVNNITAMALHLLSAGGKRLRPALTLLSAQLVGGITQQAITFAAVVELMHTATLIHDDVIDKSDLRRGWTTVHNLWGNEAAIMCGDHLYARAISILAEEGDIEVIRIMAHASSQICEGEILELQLAFHPDITEEQCIEIACLKTAELMAAACKIGALAGEANDSVAEALETYGRNLGIAFQIVDDLLDLEASSDEDTGKPVGSDLLEGKITLPVLHTLASLSPEEQAQWRKKIAQQTITPADAQELTAIAKLNGALDKVRAIAEDYARCAIASLHSINTDDSERQKWAMYLLEQVAHFVVHRRG